MSHPRRRPVLVVAVGLLLSLWLAPLALAQPGGWSPDRMKERLAARTDTLIKQLDLTEGQHAPVRAILEENNQKRIEIRTKAFENRSPETMMAMHEEMTALDEETGAKLADVLTKEQLEKYRTIQATWRQNRPGRPPRQ